MSLFLAQTRGSAYGRMLGGLVHAAAQCRQGASPPGLGAKAGALQLAAPACRAAEVLAPHNASADPPAGGAAGWSSMPVVARPGGASRLRLPTNLRQE